MAKIEAIIKENLPAGGFTVDHPRRSLEDFFLNVISTAKRDSVETAGVVSGGKIADYLEKGDESSAVLNSLIAEAQVQPETPAAAEKPEAAAEDLSGRLKDLTAETAVQPEAAPAETKPAEDLSEANAKLDDLLGNRK